LAVKTHCKRENLVFIGNQIGTGKESDVFLGQDSLGQNVAVKFHRLGRTSFRSIKRNRDYHKGRTHASWLYLSRLAALKEFAYMKVLFEHGFPVPTPIDVNRHVIVMEHLKGFTTLYHIHELKHPGKVYNTLMNLLVSLAECGLIHGDFNEFNLMVDDKDNVIMIDFPQMVSIDHPNAEEYFNRDVDGVRTFFRKRFGFHGAEYPVLGKDTLRKHNLDRQIQASGFTAELEEEFNELAAQNAQAEPDDGEEESDHSTTNANHSDPHFEKLDLQTTSVEGEEDDELDDGEDEDDDDKGNAEEDSSTQAASSSNSASKAAEESSEEEEDDDAPPGETRKERRDRLRKKSEEKAKKAKEEAEAKRKAEEDLEGPIVPEPGEEGLDEATIRRNRIIRNRVKAQMERKRLRERVHVRNAFKLQAKKNLAQQTRGWAEDL
jgi:RIO kinase 2